MTKEYASLRRKTFFVPVIGAFLLAWLVLAVGYAIHERIVASAPATLVVVIRHAEKQLDVGDNPALTEAGVARAERLAQQFASASTAFGFERIYVSQYVRSLQTAEPLATRIGVPLTTVQAEATTELVNRIRRDDAGRRVLVVAHSDTIPEIVRALAPATTVPEMSATEYGTAYVIALPRSGRPTVLVMQLP
jgi:broad specificity phosphatase PhoE